MTSETTVKHSAKRRYHLHCSCGATVVTDVKTAGCPDCGQTVVFRRGWSQWQATLGDSLPGTGHSPRADIGKGRGRISHHEEAYGDGRRFTVFGFLMLLLAVALIFLLLAPEGTIQAWRAMAHNPRPADCDWISMPVGDKHCHYESKVTTVNGRPDGERVVEWYRVND